MAKAVFESKDFDKLFNPLAEVNPQEAEVATHLSGQAQLLKSSAKAVAYKNLNGQTINENLFVQDEHNQTIQTNHHDMIESGVTTDKTEHAPQINQERTLSQDRVHSVNTHNLNANTTDERHTLNQPNVKAFHQSLTSNIPMKLDSSIEQSGQSTINQQQQKIDTQVIHSAQYEQAFGQYTHSGKVKFGSTANVGTKKLMIGPSGDTKGLDFTLRDDVKEVIPKISAKILGQSLTLPPILLEGFIITGTLELSGNLIAKGKSPVPITIDKEGLKLDLQSKINNYFANLSFKGFSDFSDPMSNPPTIEVGNENGNIEFANGGELKVIGPAVEVTYHNSFSITQSNYKGWHLKASGGSTLKVCFMPNTMKKFYEAEERNFELSNFYQQARKVAVALADSISTTPNPVIVEVSTGVILMVSTIGYIVTGGV